MARRRALGLLGSAVVFSIAMPLLGNGAAAAVRVIKFSNATTIAVNDLHLLGDQGVTVDFTKTEPFPSERGVDGGREHNLWGALVVADNDATVRLTTQEQNLTLEKWWWTKGGTATKDGDKVGDEKKDSGLGTLTFRGGPASGGGRIRVSIDGHTQEFTTVAGASATSTKAAVAAFLNTFQGDSAFSLISHGDLPLPIGEGLLVAGNVQGDESRALSVTIVAPDPTLLLRFAPRGEPLPMAWPLGAIVLAGMLVGGAALTLRRHRSVGA